MTITETVKQHIEKATAQNPITSTDLIAIINRDLGVKVSARKIRFIVADLREKNHLPILATRSGKQGYYLCGSESDFDAYEKEIRAHSIRELSTLKNVRLNFFGTKQLTLDLLEAI